MESKELLMEKIESFAKEREDIEKNIDSLMISAYAEICKTEIMRLRVDGQLVGRPIPVSNWIVNEIIDKDYFVEDPNYTFRVYGSTIESLRFIVLLRKSSPMTYSLISDALQRCIKEYMLGELVYRPM